MTRALALLGILVLAGCSSKDGGSPSATAAQSSAPVAPASSAPPRRPPPDDLDPTALQKVHKCTPKSKDGPCKVLEALASCSAWDGVAPSGDGRWLGLAWDVKDGKTKEGYAVLRSKTVPQDQVPGGVPAKLGLAMVPDDLPAKLGIEKAVRAYARHDVPQKGNAGVAWVKDKTDFPEEIGMVTAKKHVVILSADVAFVCKGPAQQLFYVQPRPAGAAKGDGLFAELWGVSW